MTARSNVVSKNRVLLVEGLDDRRVVERLIERSGRTQSFEIMQANGIERLISRIQLEVRMPRRETLGVIVDADSDIEARWNAIRGQFSLSGIRLPVERTRRGVIVPSEPRVGIWLMPDNDSNGQLEDFVQSMIPSDDRVWPLADAFVNSIPREYREFSANKTIRAKLYTWLATRKEPGPMSRAIQANYLDIDNDLVQSFLGFLSRLFDQP